MANIQITRNIVNHFLCFYEHLNEITSEIHYIVKTSNQDIISMDEQVETCFQSLLDIEKTLIEFNMDIMTTKEYIKNIPKFNDIPKEPEEESWDS